MKTVKNPARRRAWEIALEVAIGLAVALSALIWVDYFPEVSFPKSKWVGLAINTAVFFGYGISGNRRHWQHGLFWVVFVGLLVVHLGLWLEFLRSIQHSGFIWFATVGPAEYFVIYPVLDWAGRYSGTRRSEAIR